MCLSLNMSMSPMSPEQIKFFAKKGKTMYPDSDELVNKLKRIHEEGICHLLLPLLTLPENDEPFKKPRFVDSPTSPQYELTSQSEEEEEKINTFDNVFFVSQDPPFDINSAKDAFLLDPSNKKCELHVTIFAKRDSQRNIFARHIRAYNYGIALNKHSAPYGELGVLNNQSFTIEKKIYNTQSDLAFVIVKEVSSPYREFMLEPAFFNGWLDANYVV